jgi:hypothetical protein
MTKQFSLLTIFFAALTNLALAQCDNCDKALAKDYMQYSSSTLQQLNILRVMDKETFEEYKKSGGGGGGLTLGIPGVVSATIDGSSNYDEFRQNREKLFQLYQYNYSEAQAKDELRIVTNPIAYTEWSKCITTCYENQANLSKVYGYISYADSNTVIVKVKYKPASTSKNRVNCTIDVDNGTVLKQFGRGRGNYYESIEFPLKKAEDIGFTIKRTNKYQNTVISIVADGTDVFRGISKYSTPVSMSFINATAKYTVVDVKEVPKEWLSNKTESPNLHEVKCIFAEALKKSNPNFFCDGKYVAFNNTIALPDLPDNQYYKSFTGVECFQDNDGACRWNADNAARAVQNISADKRHASVTFKTGSKNCVWIWKGQVYEVTRTVSQQSKTVAVKDSYFVVTVPKNASGATLIVNISGNEHLVELGKDDMEGKIRFVKQTDDGTNNYYSYFVK